MMTDNSLDDLLRGSRKLEPKGAFEDQVWHRIRTDKVAAREPGWLLWPLPLRMVWGGAVAIAASLVLGIGLALLFPEVVRERDTASVMIHASSLTGDYLALASGGNHD